MTTARPKYIGAIDQGTTSTRFIVFDQDARLIASAQKEFRQIFPKPGWVEHDPQEIWQSTVAVIAEAATNNGLTRHDIACIGITNQRETVVVWNRYTGEAIYNAIVWQDTRVAGAVTRFSEAGGKDRYRARTGLPLTTYFSGLKLSWLLDNVQGARDSAEKGSLLCGTIDSFLLWKLTGGVRSGIHA